MIWGCAPGSAGPAAPSKSIARCPQTSQPGEQRWRRSPVRLASSVQNSAARCSTQIQQLACDYERACAGVLSAVQCSAASSVQCSEARCSTQIQQVACDYERACAGFLSAEQCSAV
eukprot:9503927-Pyramimonas_sp.AAC.1